MGRANQSGVAQRIDGYFYIRISWLKLKRLAIILWSDLHGTGPLLGAATIYDLAGFRRCSY